MPKLLESLTWGAGVEVLIPEDLKPIQNQINQLEQRITDLWKKGYPQVGSLLDDLAAALGSRVEPCETLPEGSGAAVLSRPLPKDHWLTAEGENTPPALWLEMGGIGPDPQTRKSIERDIREVGKYALRSATSNGKEQDLDPDALLQNLVIGFLGINPRAKVEPTPLGGDHT